MTICQWLICRFPVIEIPVSFAVKSNLCFNQVTESSNVMYTYSLSKWWNPRMKFYSWKRRKSANGKFSSLLDVKIPYPIKLTLISFFYSSRLKNQVLISTYVAREACYRNCVVYILYDEFCALKVSQKWQSKDSFHYLKLLN